MEHAQCYKAIKELKGLESVQNWIFNFKDVSLRPKSIFWFRTDTEIETKIGQYFSIDTVTDTEKRAIHGTWYT